MWLQMRIESANQLQIQNLPQNVVEDGEHDKLIEDHCSEEQLNEHAINIS
jgi:hypothetical protein